MRRNLGHLNLASLYEKNAGISSRSGDDLSDITLSLQHMDPISSELVTNNNASELGISEEVIFDHYSVLDDNVLSTENAMNAFGLTLSSSYPVVALANSQDGILSSTKPGSHEPLYPPSENPHFCVICQDFEKSVVLLPCRHLCLCANCGNEVLISKLSRCPLCRTKISRTLSVFL